MRRQLPCALALALGLGCAATHATLTILRSDGSEAPPKQADKVYNPSTGGWDITLKALYAPGLFTEYHIHGDAGEIIDNLIIDVPCLEDPYGNCVPSGSPVVVYVVSDPPSGIHSVHNIIQTGTAETIVSDVDVTYDIGAVEVEMIGIMVAGRDVIGPVHATVANAPDLGITKVKAERNLLGDVTAENGRIITISAPNGSIGTADNPVELRAKHRILLILAGDSIHADIDTHTNGGSGWLYKLSAPHFTGSLRTEKLDKNPYNGEPGLIEIPASFHGEIILDRSFTDPTQMMILPACGLQGQIIINRDNQPDGGWTSPVYLGDDGDPNQIVLDEPQYTHTAETLGGGAVGLVPFALHLQSCDPTSGSEIQAETGDPPIAVTLRHYGPIKITGSEPLVIERRDINSTGSFAPVPLDIFAITTAPKDPNAILLTAAPGESGFEPGYDYRISATSHLRCDVPIQPPVQWQADYELAVLPPSCPGDIDGSDAVDVLDLLILLGHWGPAQDSPADLDGNGIVDVTDLLILLAFWGPC